MSGNPLGARNKAMNNLNVALVSVTEALFISWLLHPLLFVA